MERIVKVLVDQRLCLCYEWCSHVCPDVFDTQGSAAAVKNTAIEYFYSMERAIKKAVAECPVEAITIHTERVKDKSLWLTSTVVSLLQVISKKNRFDCLPILADALEEAGCTDHDILQHCREGGDHVDRCWAVDLLLSE